MKGQALRLTQSMVNVATANGKAKSRLWDSGVPGMTLVVTAKGGRAYYVIYRDGVGKQREVSIGDAKLVTLEQARLKARALLAGAKLHGVDPVAQKKAAREQAQAAHARAVGALSKLYFRDAEQRLSTARIELEKGMYRRHLEPELDASPLETLDADGLASILHVVAENSGLGAANTTLEVIRQMLALAVRRHWLPVNVALSLKPYPKTSRERVAAEDELGRIWLALEQMKATKRAQGRSTAIALQLAILTLQRRSEVAGLAISEVDSSKQLWVIPGPRTKNKKRPHSVPLSRLASELVEEALDGVSHGAAFQGRDGGPLSPKVLTRAFDRLATGLELENITLHDMRRTGATLMTSERVGVLGEIVSRILNHTPPGPRITAVYNRNDYLPQKRAALEAWALEVERIAKVVGGTPKAPGTAPKAHEATVATSP